MFPSFTRSSNTPSSLNFTASLASLEPSVRSVWVFTDLALRSSRPCPPRLLLLSSIAVFYSGCLRFSSFYFMLISSKMIAKAQHLHSRSRARKACEWLKQDTQVHVIVIGSLTALNVLSRIQMGGRAYSEKAAEETTLRPITVRMGQACGGINGQWNTTEWFPNIV